MDVMIYGLIGEKLKHSYSKEIHQNFSKCQYDLWSLDEINFDLFLKNKKFFKNRVPKCPLEDIYIIEACIAGSVYLRYMKHRKQRQVTPAAVFRLGAKKLPYALTYGS